MRALLLLCATTSTALAAPDVVTYGEVVETNYRPAMIAANLATAALIVTPLALDGHIPEKVGIPILITGDVGLVLGGAIVHFAHGEVGRGVGSLFLRGSGAAVGAALGSVVPCDDEGEFLGCLGPVMVGAGIGLGAAVVIETVFMTDQREVRRSPSWTPTFNATADGGSVGLAGTF